MECIYILWYGSDFGYINFWLMGYESLVWVDEGNDIEICGMFIN